MEPRTINDYIQSIKGLSLSIIDLTTSIILRSDRMANIESEIKGNRDIGTIGNRQSTIKGNRDIGTIDNRKSTIKGNRKSENRDFRNRS